MNQGYEVIICMKYIFLFIVLGILLFVYHFYDDQVRECQNERCHFVRYNDLRIGSRDHHIVLYKWTEDKGWE